jgi:hypothetical protein
MKLSHPISLVLLFASVAVSGCGRDSVAPTNPGGAGSHVEQDAIAMELAQQPAILEDGISDDPAEVALDVSGGGTAAIQPRFFHRVIRLRERTFEFAFSDTDSTGRPTRAIVTIDTRLRGSLVIQVGVPGSDGSGVDSASYVIRKPIDELRVRRVLMRRARMSDDDHIRWRVVATSGVEVNSRNHTTNVLSLRVQNDGRDTTITDPLAFIRLASLLRITPATEVTLTVTTERSDDEVFLHAADRRFRFHNNGDGTFTGVWRAGLFVRGMRHFGVDALSHGTLFDDEAPYDSNRWVLPYVIVPEVLAEPLAS